MAYCGPSIYTSLSLSSSLCLLCQQAVPSLLPGNLPLVLQVILNRCNMSIHLSEQILALAIVLSVALLAVMFFQELIFLMAWCSGAQTRRRIRAGTVIASLASTDSASHTSVDAVVVPTRISPLCPPLDRCTYLLPIVLHTQQVFRMPTKLLPLAITVFILIERIFR